MEKKDNFNEKEFYKKQNEYLTATRVFNRSKEEMEMIEKDPYSHFLKYVFPFMTEEEKAKREEGDLFDSGAFDDDENELVNSFDLDALDRLIDFEEEE